MTWSRDYNCIATRRYTLSLAKFVGMALIIAHWLACLWRVTVELEVRLLR